MFREIRVQQAGAGFTLAVRQPNGQEFSTAVPASPGDKLLWEALQGLPLPSALCTEVVKGISSGAWLGLQLVCETCGRETNGELVVAAPPDQVAMGAWLGFAQRGSAHYRADQEAERLSYLAGNNPRIPLPSCSGRFLLVLAPST